MLSIIWTLVVAVIGLVMWLISTNPKVNEVGRILFCIGTFWTVYLLGGATFVVGR